MDPWPFAQPRNVAVITVWRVLRGHDPILTVFHHGDDGGWTFLNTIDGQTPDLDDAAVVALEEVTTLDPSIIALADLPEGWHAWHQSPSHAWQRAESPDA